MITYNPLDGLPISTPTKYKPRHCFLMTRLGDPVPKGVKRMRKAVRARCKAANYKTIDAQTKVTGKDFLLKIINLIAATPLSVAIVHEDIPQKSLMNIYYEFGLAQAMGKETVIVKSPGADVPSDFVRTEFIEFNEAFSANFDSFLGTMLEAAESYETIADQMDRNPVLALDYLKRAYLINGNARLKKKARKITGDASLADRAANSVESLAGGF